MDNEKEAKAPFRERVAPACVSGCRGSHGAFWGPGGQEAAPQFTARTLRIWDKPHGAAGLRVRGPSWVGPWTCPESLREPRGLRAKGDRWSPLTAGGRGAGALRGARPSPAPTAHNASLACQGQRQVPGPRVSFSISHPAGSRQLILEQN